MSDSAITGARALVTGASGFIGGRLVQRLLASGTEVHGISRAHVPGMLDGVRWWRAEVADAEAVLEIVRRVRPDLVFNLAGETRAARTLELVLPTFRTNLAGTVNLLGAAAEVGCRRIVLTGSLEEPPRGADVPPSSPYAVSKWAGEAYGQMFHAAFGLPVVALRVFMVYGPGQTDLRKLVPYTILRLLRHEPPELSSGLREIDWVYVDDVVDAFVAAATAPSIEGATVDVGSGELVSVREVVERLARRIAPDVVPRFGAVEDRSMEQVRLADVGTAEALLGWRATTSLDEGLARTVAWYTALADLKPE